MYTFMAVQITLAPKSESKAFMPLFGPLFDMPWVNLIGVLEGYFPLEYVFPDPQTFDFNVYLYNTAGYYGSRNWRGKFVDERARALAERQNNVYAYQLNRREEGSGSAPFSFIYGAMHTMDISFFFGEDSSTWGYGYNTETDTNGRKALSDAMMTYLSNFARFGDPNGPRWHHRNIRHKKGQNNLTTWEPWSNEAESSKNIIFDANTDTAILTMSNDEVNIVAEMGKLEAELANWPAYYPAVLKDVARGFQWQMPE